MMLRDLRDLFRFGSPTTRSRKRSSGAEDSAFFAKDDTIVVISEKRHDSMGSQISLPQVSCVTPRKQKTRTSQERKTPYEYAPLPSNSKNAIRLVGLSPGKGDEPMKAEVIQTDTQNPSIEYEALSYAWDMRPDIRWDKISVGDKEISVTAGLMQGLKALRSSREVRWLWVDQICINEKDEYERSRQMTIMRDIYSSAARTTIWLGEARPEDRVVLPLIKACTVFKFNIRDRAEVLFENERYKFKDFSGAFSSSLANFKDDNLVPVQLRSLTPDVIEKVLGFFARRWFQRLWPFLEVVVSKNKTIVRCGSEELQWADLGLFAYWLTHSSLVDIPGPKIPRGLECANWMYAYWLNQDSAFPMSAMLRSARKFEAAEDRDKVFAILRLSSEVQVAGKNLPKHLTIDTRLSMKEVYTRVACYMLHRNQDLSILSLVQQLRPTIDNNRLPSWVPDWTQSEMMHPLWVPEANEGRRFNAGPPLKTRINLTTNSGLTVTGFKVAEVVPNSIICSIRDKDVHAMELGRLGSGITLLKWLAHMAAAVLDDEKMAMNMWWRAALTLTAGRDAMGMLVKKRPGLDLTAEAEAIERHARSFCTFVATLNPDFFQIPEELRRTITEMQAQMASYAEGEDPRSIHNAIFRAIRNRTLFSVNGTDWWLAPLHTAPGDIACILEGGRVPLLLRPRKSGSGYQLVGECFNIDVMYGDAWDMWKEGKPQKFELV